MGSWRHRDAQRALRPLRSALPRLSGHNSLFFFRAQQSHPCRSSEPGKNSVPTRNPRPESLVGADDCWHALLLVSIWVHYATQKKKQNISSHGQFVYHRIGPRSSAERRTGAHKTIVEKIRGTSWDIVGGDLLLGDECELIIGRGWLINLMNGLVRRRRRPRVDAAKKKSDRETKKEKKTKKKRKRTHVASSCHRLWKMSRTKWCPLHIDRVFLSNRVFSIQLTG